MDDLSNSLSGLCPRPGGFWVLGVSHTSWTGSLTPRVSLTLLTPNHIGCGVEIVGFSNWRSPWEHPFIFQMWKQAQAVCVGFVPVFCGFPGVPVVQD